MSYEIEEIEVENEDALEAIEREEEMYDEDELERMYIEHLDCENIIISGIEFNPSRILEELDPTAYSCGLIDFKDNIQETETKYDCPTCGSNYEDEDDAKWCCQESTIVKYEVDGKEFETEAEAQDRADELNEED